jgi:uncharacterized membrane protein
MRKDAIALIGMFLTLIFILIAFYGTWYSVSMSVMTQDGSLEMTLHQMVSRFGDIEQTITYEEAKTSSFTGLNTDQLDVFSNTMYIVIIALFFAFIGVLSHIGHIYRLVKSDKLKLLGGIFGILVFIFGVVAVIYFMTSGFYETDFWFSQTLMGTEMTGGPGYAWYLMIIAAIIALISSIPLFTKQAVKK